MKPIPAHAFFIIGLRQPIVAGVGRQRVMEGRVKHRDVGRVRKHPAGFADAGDVGRVV